LITPLMPLAFSSVEPACPSDIAYAFSLTDLPRDLTTDMYTPPDVCFNPVTIPSLLESGALEYSWVPWSSMDSDLAPSGAFVYKMSDGGMLYKKITAVPSDDPSATLKFGLAQEETETAANTFDEVEMLTIDDSIVAEMKRGIKCSEAAISFTTTAPFSTYDKFFWAAGPFKLAGPNSGCGAYVYEKKGGGLVYHSC